MKELGEVPSSKRAREIRHQINCILSSQIRRKVKYNKNKKANKKIKKKKDRLVARIFIVGCCRSPTPVAAFIAIC